MKQFTRFLFRGKKYNVATARPATAAPREDDDDNRNQLSGAFVIVLLLHFIAIVGVFAFARIKEKNKVQTPPETAAQATAPKPNPAKQATPNPPAPVAAILPTPTPAAPPAHDSVKAPQSGQRIVHIVKERETLTKIAFAYSVGVSDIRAANKLKVDDTLRTGQALTIPGGKASTKAAPATESKTPAASGDGKTPNTYIVKKNDTAVKIAREHGCTYEELVKLNNIKDPKKIKLGQVLKLPVKNP